MPDLELLWRKHRGAVRSIASRYCRDHDELDDLIADVALKMVLFFDRWDRDRWPFLAWAKSLIWSITGNNIKAKSRQKNPWSHTVLFCDLMFEPLVDICGFNVTARNFVLG